MKIHNKQRTTLMPFTLSEKRISKHSKHTVVDFTSALLSTNWSSLHNCLTHIPQAERYVSVVANANENPRKENVKINNEISRISRLHIVTKTA